ncbi:hypothetical protein HN832_02745 [archaeon]|jgi:hypothetical protein|nr:hypothetical protein [archaeon]MBT4373273.1 hypothetical protein [archaeon]MBT4531618.1 hypothetical protein [archaeon]MBT7001204.1 hypothetical protein [archaeon]MBT7282310.1 hypothetical protein [archaeon]
MAREEYIVEFKRRESPRYGTLDKTSWAGEERSDKFDEAIMNATVGENEEEIHRLATEESAKRGIVY